MGQFFTADSANQIRAALDTSLDAGSLADEIISLPIFAETAEAEVMARDPLALTYAVGSVQRARLERAVIYITAARLALRIPQLVSESEGDYKYTMGPKDWTKDSRLLRGMAEREIALNTLGGLPATLPSFWLARGSRGR